jgi:hypothetical protein
LFLAFFGGSAPLAEHWFDAGWTLAGMSVELESFGFSCSLLLYGKYVSGESYRVNENILE